MTAAHGPCPRGGRRGESLRAFGWFARRPRLYPILGSVLWSKIRRSPAGRGRTSIVRAAAARWCEDRARSTADALGKLTGAPRAPVASLYTDVFKSAADAARRCPVAMGGAADLDLVYWLAESQRATAVIETGVAYGWSTLALLLSLHRREGALLVSVDRPYGAADSEAYVGCVVPPWLRSTWRLLRGADREMLPVAVRDLGTIDMCHYDSDKSYGGRRWAYALLWDALRTGGCFVSDDVGDNFAFRDFCAELGREPVVVRPPHVGGTVKYVGVVMKTERV